MKAAASPFAGSNENEAHFAGPDVAGPPPQAILDAIDQNVALLDGHGTIVAVNTAWTDFARRHGCRSGGAGIGMDYLRVCEAAEEPEACAVAESLRALLAGGTKTRTHAYSMIVAEEARSFVATLSRVESGGEAWVLVMHEDVTAFAKAAGHVQLPTDERLRIQLDERRRISRELHDSISQYLIAIELLLLSAHHRTENPLVEQLIGEAENATAEALREVRATTYLLHAPMIKAGGLIDALETLVTGYSRRVGLPITFAARVEDRSAIAAVEIALFRIAQEALANVHRHADASIALVELECDGVEVVLTVQDDGKGLDDGPGTSPMPDGVGLRSMRARTEELGGRLELRSTGKGTTLIARIPLSSI